MVFDHEKVSCKKRFISSLKKFQYNFIKTTVSHGQNRNLLFEHYRASRPIVQLKRCSSGGDRVRMNKCMVTYVTRFSGSFFHFDAFGLRVIYVPRWRTSF